MRRAVAHATPADTTEAVDALFGAKARSMAAGPDAIADPGKILKWVANDRATVEFTSQGDVAAKASAFQKLLKQWIVHV